MRHLLKLAGTCLFGVLAPLSLYGQGSEDRVEQLGLSSTVPGGGARSGPYAAGDGTVRTSSGAVIPNPSSLEGVEVPVPAPRLADVPYGPGQSGSAYERAYQQLAPLGPEAIMDMLGRMDGMKKAVSSTPAKPEARTISIPVSLSPGETPSTIRLAPGYATALVLLDSTGQPWPATSAVVGDQSQFELIRPASPGNVLSLVPRREYARSNILVLLEGANAPAVLYLETSPDVSYYRASLLIDGAGPNAAISSPARTVPSASEPLMRQILDGMRPTNSRQVEISGGVASGFIVDDAFYLRTQLSLVSPSYAKMLAGTHDWRVYRLPIVSPVFASDGDGRIVELRLDGSALIDQALSVRSTSLGSLAYPGASR